MKKLSVAIIYGGEGGEHEISCASAKNILNSIDRTRLDPYPVLIDKAGIWRHTNYNGRRVHLAKVNGKTVIRDRYGSTEIDAAFPILHGDYGEDGRIQGALDALGLPYVGCGVTAGAVAADKILTKRIADSLGIPTVPSVSLTGTESLPEARELAEAEIGYPMFIKPSGLGSSLGCSLVTERDGFDDALSLARECDGRVLIEEYLDGAREVECAYLKTRTRGEIFTDPGEILKRGVYTYDAKYGDNSTVRLSVRAELDSSTKARVKRYSKLLVDAIGIRQLSRIDFFLKNGELYLNEINTMPGFTEGSLYPMMINACGITTPELITELIEDAI